MKKKTCVSLLWGLGLSGVLAAGDLHTAIPTKPLAEIQELMDQCANLDEPDEQGNTPLMVAVLASRKDVVDLLLSKKVDITHRNVAGQDALDLALQVRREASSRLRNLCKGVTA